MSEAEKPKLFVPKLNREGVADWTGGGGANYIGLSDYGRFRLAFKKLRFENGQKNNMFYAADCKVITSEAVDSPKQPEAKDGNPEKKQPAYVPMPDEKYDALIAQLKKNAVESKYRSCWCDPTKKHSPGTISTITFQVGRPGTSEDPKRGDRDDRVLVEFLRVIQGLARGTVIDFESVIPKLVAAPAIAADDDSEGLFDLDCIPRAQPNFIVDPAVKFGEEGHVLRTSIQVWPNRYYRLVG